ncbi:hypothetical protein AGMMS49983_11160 [Clostridia bacterium]|nr:hypothetical protein AGMMS49983_11160 [Clostridia bacterium]
MSNLDDLVSAVEVPRKTMVLFFVVDTSGSMSGAKIGAANTAIEEVLPEIADLSAGNADAEIKIALLTFSSGAVWQTPAPIPAAHFYFSSLSAGGLTDLGQCCEMLNEKLSRNAFMNDTVGSYAPVIFLLSDGAPTDDYQAGLGKLWQNKWFKAAIRVAIAIGSDANETVLEEFTGGKEAVLRVHTPEALRKMIQLVAIRSSQIGSTSTSSIAQEAGLSKQNEFLGQVQAEVTQIQQDDDDDDDWE